MTHSKMETRDLMGMWRALILATLAIVSGCSADEESSSAPVELRVDVTTIELGDLDWGTEIEQSIRLSNPGATAIDIYGINTSCGCARVLNPPKSVAATGETSLCLKFRMQLPPGVWRSPLTIEHSGPNSPLRVDMRARVRRAWRFSENHDRLPELEPGSVHAGVVRLESTLGTAPRIAQIRSSSADLKTTSAQAFGETGVEIPYLLQAPKAAGYHRYELVLFCAPGDPHERIQASVAVWVTGPIDGLPRQLSFPRKESGDRKLILRSAPGSRLRFVSATGLGLAVTTREVKEEGHELRLVLNARAPVKAAQLKLQYECDGRPGKIAIGIRSRDDK